MQSTEEQQCISAQDRNVVAPTASELDQLKTQFPDPIDDRLEDLTKRGDRWEACCPFHSDLNPSFKLSRVDGVYLWHCFGCNAGGSVIDFVMKYDECSLDEAIKTVKSEMGINSNGPHSTRQSPERKSKPVSIDWFFGYLPQLETSLNQNPKAQAWLASRGISVEIAKKLRLGLCNPYFTCGRKCDLCGHRDAIVLPRFWKGKPRGVKFRALDAPDSAHKWIQLTGSAPGKEFICYADMEPAANNYEYVCVVEGQLDAALLLSCGFDAVAIMETTAVPEKGKESASFRESVDRLNKYDRTILIGDQDEVGKAAMQRLATHLSNGVLASLPEGVKDVGELYKRDGLEKFKDYIATCISNARRSTPVKDRPYRLYNLKEFLELPIVPSAPVLGPILREKNIGELYSWRGLGKTFVSASMGLAIAGGGRFLKWQAPSPRHTLYVDGEMAGAEFQDRLKRLQAGVEVPIDPAYFLPMNFDVQSGWLPPDISTLVGQQVIEDMIGDAQAEVLILDNLSCLAQISDLDDEKWLPIANWLLALRRKGITCLLNHHANKTGGQRGISRREDAFDVVMKLDRPKNYRYSEGLRCELLFEKTRSFKGEDAMPLEIELIEGNGGSLVWTYCESREALRKQVIDLLKGEWTVREIEEKLDGRLSRSAIGRIRIEWQESKAKDRNNNPFASSSSVNEQALDGAVSSSDTVAVCTIGGQ